MGVMIELLFSDSLLLLRSPPVDTEIWKGEEDPLPPPALSLPFISLDLASASPLFVANFFQFSIIINDHTHGIKN